MGSPGQPVPSKPSWSYTGAMGTIREKDSDNQIPFPSTKIDSRRSIMALSGDFERQIYINCPFDNGYLPLLRPLLFTVRFFGFIPRIASESLDLGQNRIDKICSIIQDCRYSIHDLSRLRASKQGEVFRMNMPFELGIDYGLRYFGGEKIKQKKFLILEKDRYEFHKAISDLSGVDIKAHKNKPDEIVRAIRDWFVEAAGIKGLAEPQAGLVPVQRFHLRFLRCA